MKKLIYIFCITFLVLACAGDDDTTEDETQQVDPNDLDGDGVTNQQEAVDNTDPNVMCSFRVNSIYYPATSNAWRNLDCDGDGVSNGLEVNSDGNDAVEGNGTNPLNRCDFDLSQQDTTPNDVWFTLDCDQDGVTNQQEVLDNTDPLSSCDLVINNQTLEPSSNWIHGDCDQDGRSNSVEIEDGTDPFDPLDYFGAGNVLIFAKESDLIHNFINQGTRYENIAQANGPSILRNYEYDSQGNLIHLSFEAIDIYYTYTNGEISNVTRTEGSYETISFDVAVEANTIYTYNGTEPDDLFTKKFNFNNQNKLVSIESYILSNGIYRFYEQTFEYDATFENLLYSRVESLQEYIESTGEFQPLENFLTVEYTFNNNEDGVLNPFYNVYQDILNNTILNFGTTLSSEVNKDTPFYSFGIFNKKFVNNMNRVVHTNSSTTTTYFNWEASQIQPNGLPNKITHSAFQGGWDFSTDYEIFYE